jgi:hypothetical protein
LSVAELRESCPDLEDLVEEESVVLPDSGSSTGSGNEMEGPSTGSGHPVDGSGG